MKFTQKDIDESFSILKRYFKSKDDFIEQIDRLGSEKEKFLRLSLVYGALVKDSHLPKVDENELLLKFINDTFKFISLMSLIEALYSDQDYFGFFQWLNKKDQDHRFPIKDRNELREIFQEYTNDHGSIKKAVHFFNDVPKEYRYILERGIEHYKYKETTSYEDIKREEPDIDRIAKTLYQMRSNFIHAAKIVTDVSGIHGMSKVGNRVVMTHISIDDLSKLFEIVMLSKFGIKVKS